MKIEQLRTFVTVATLGSVSKAARELSLSQAAVSHQILAMEAELNFDLFLHEGRKCQLTEAGSQFLVRVVPVIHMYQSAVEDVRDRLEIVSSSNELAVVYPQECNPNVCAKLAETYWQKNPHVLVSFAGAESAKKALQSVRDRASDACLCIETRQARELGLAFWPLRQVSETCIVEGGSRLAQLATIQMGDLDGVIVNFQYRRGTFVAEDALRDEIARLQPGAVLREPPMFGGASERISRKEIEHVIIAPDVCVNTNSSTRRFIALAGYTAAFGIATRQDAGRRIMDFVRRLQQHYREHPDEPVV